MSMSDVQRALLTSVEAVLGVIPTAYANVKFTPPDRALWASVHFMPNDPTPYTLGDDGEDMADGVVQVDLNYPSGTGDAESRAMAETFRRAFRAGARPLYNGQEVVVRSCGRSPGRPVDGWFRVSISITWYALIPR